MRAVSRSQNRSVTGTDVGAHQHARMRPQRVIRSAAARWRTRRARRPAGRRRRGARRARRRPSSAPRDTLTTTAPGGSRPSTSRPTARVGLGRARRGDHQHVALGGEPRQIPTAPTQVDARRSTPLGPAPDSRDAHPQRQRPPCHGAADPAQADDPHPQIWRAPVRGSCGHRTRSGSSVAPPARGRCDRVPARSRRSTPSTQSAIGSAWIAGGVGEVDPAAAQRAEARPDAGGAAVHPAERPAPAVTTPGGTPKPR